MSSFLLLVVLGILSILILYNTFKLIDQGTRRRVLRTRTAAACLCNRRGFQYGVTVYSPLPHVSMMRRRAASSRYSAKIAKQRISGIIACDRRATRRRIQVMTIDYIRPKSIEEERRRIYIKVAIERSIRRIHALFKELLKVMHKKEDFYNDN